MNKLFALLSVFFLFTFAPLASAANLQMADNPDYLDTTGISTGSCTLINADGSFSTTPATGFTVSAHNKDGNAMFKCRGKVTAPVTKNAVSFDITSPGFVGVLCDIFEDGIYLGSTNDWQEIVSASGQATLTCQKHP